MKFKDKEVRQHEIIEIAEQLFHTKGYEYTSVNEILKQAEIAKGTFYHHFSSKEEVLDAVVKKGVDKAIEEFGEIINDKDLTALKKLNVIVNYKFQAICEEDYSDIDAHKSGNALMHQKSLTMFLEKMAPEISKIIEQGIDEGDFEVKYPREITEILFAAVNFLFDPGLFEWTQEELTNKIKAFEYTLEQVLSVPEGSFQFTKPK